MSYDSRASNAAMKIIEFLKERLPDAIPSQRVEAELYGEIASIVYEEFTKP